MQTDADAVDDEIPFEVDKRRVADNGSPLNGRVPVRSS